MSVLEARKARAQAWFEAWRDDICAAFEALEADLPAHAPLADRAAGGFLRKAWSRADHNADRPTSGAPKIRNSNPGAAKADPGRRGRLASNVGRGVEQDREHV